MTYSTFAIVLPVYNHATLVRPVVEEALKITGHVIVVDDGSSDELRTALEGMKVHLLTHEKNRGKGAAIWTASREAQKMGMSHIITIDADGQHDPHDCKSFLPRIAKEPRAIIVGKRRFDNTVPALSRFGRHFSNFWFRLQTGRSVGDIQSGFRAYPLSVLEQLEINEKGYAFEVEVLVKAAWAGIPVRDVDISVHYPPPDQRISHFHMLKDNFRLSMLNTRLTVRALVPLPHRRFSGEGATQAKISILHPVRSLTILLRENLLPKPLALAGALGVFLGALPLIACQAIVILATANFLRLNRITAFAASQICIPPLVPALCIEVGYFMRHGRFLTEISMRTLGYQAIERIYEWFLGSLILGPLLGLAAGCTIYFMAAALKRGIDGHGE